MSERVHCALRLCVAPFVLFCLLKNKYLFNMFSGWESEHRHIVYSMTSIWMHNWVRARHAHVSRIFFPLNNNNNFSLCCSMLSDAMGVRFSCLSPFIKFHFVYFRVWFSHFVTLNSCVSSNNHNIKTVFFLPETKKSTQTTSIKLRFIKMNGTISFSIFLVWTWKLILIYWQNVIWYIKPSTQLSINI